MYKILDQNMLGTLLSKEQEIWYLWPLPSCFYTTSALYQDPCILQYKREKQPSKPYDHTFHDPDQ